MLITGVHIHIPPIACKQNNDTSSHGGDDGETLGAAFSEGTVAPHTAKTVVKIETATENARVFVTGQDHVAVAQHLHYAYRGEALRYMSLYMYTCFIALQKKKAVPEKKSGVNGKPKRFVLVLIVRFFYCITYISSQQFV